MKQIYFIILVLMSFSINAQTYQERQDEYSVNYRTGIVSVGALGLGTSKTIIVTYNKPFDAGVVPIVTINAVNETSVLLDTFSITISSSTNTGFTAIVQKTIVGIWVQNLKLNYYSHK
jgi:hypothetical protein